MATDIFKSFLGGGDTPPAPQVMSAPQIDTTQTPPIDANAADYAKKKLEELKARNGRNALKVDPSTGTQTGSDSTGLSIPL